MVLVVVVVVVVLVVVVVVVLVLVVVVPPWSQLPLVTPLVSAEERQPLLRGLRRGWRCRSTRFTRGKFSTY